MAAQAEQRTSLITKNTFFDVVPVQSQATTTRRGRSMPPTVSTRSTATSVRGTRTQDSAIPKLDEDVTNQIIDEDVANPEVHNMLEVHIREQTEVINELYLITSKAAARGDPLEIVQSVREACGDLLRTPSWDVAGAYVAIAGLDPVKTKLHGVDKRAATQVARVGDVLSLRAAVRVQLGLGTTILQTALETYRALWTPTDKEAQTELSRLTNSIKKLKDSHFQNEVAYWKEISGLGPNVKQRRQAVRRGRDVEGPPHQEPRVAGARGAGPGLDRLVRGGSSEDPFEDEGIRRLLIETSDPIPDGDGKWQNEASGSPP